MVGWTGLVVVTFGEHRKFHPRAEEDTMSGTVFTQYDRPDSPYVTGEIPSGDYDDAAWAARAEFDERPSDRDLAELKREADERRALLRADEPQGVGGGAAKLLIVNRRWRTLTVCDDRKGAVKTTVSYVDTAELAEQVVAKLKARGVERRVVVDDFETAVRRVRAHFESRGIRTRTWTPS
jgi:hypothetical protein